MGLRIRDIDLESVLSAMALHPLIVLPPNDADFYTTARASNAFGALPATLPQRLVSGVPVQTFGGASNVHVVVSGGAGFTGSDSVTIRVTGRLVGKRQIEDIVVVGTGGATQHTMGLKLFDWVDSCVVIATGGAVGTETFAVGIGGGSAAQAIRIPNPVPDMLPQTVGPGAAPGAWAIMAIQTSGGTIDPTLVTLAPDTDERLQKDSVLYATSVGTQTRTGVVVFNDPNDLNVIRNL